VKITGLDGKEYSWNPSGKESSSKKRSNLHEKAKKLLDILFPYDRILEEVSLVGTNSAPRRGTLRADFFIPNRNLIIEVHGEQHFKFNKFFFKNKLAFYRAKARDKDKKEWCELNDIRIVEFNHDEDVDDWRRKIEQ
jgi:very-short-patch-repair endonuclease